MGQSESVSLCCVPLIPLRGMRSSQVDIEVFDGWTRRREMEGLNKVLTHSSPPALFDSLTPASLHHLQTPPKRMTFDHMIKKAKLADRSQAGVKNVMVLPLDQTQEETNVGAGDRPRYYVDVYVNIPVSKSDTKLHPKSETHQYIRVSQSDTKLHLKRKTDLNIPVFQSDPKLVQTDLKNENDLKTNKPNRSFRNRIRQVIQRFSLKRKNSQKDMDVEKVIQASAKSCKDAQVEEAVKKVFTPYLMDRSFDEICRYRRHDVVYGRQKMVRKFGQMLMDMNEDEIKAYRGGFVKVSSVLTVSVRA